ncbi:MAG: Nif3-like dinuclear metal center hexameric protein [Bacteroidia bacterium]
MALKIKDLTSYLEKIAPLGYQESYDNAGLLTGNKDSVIDNVLITLDCTEEVIDEAITSKCKLVIAHHPIIFKGLKKLTGSNYVERTVIKAVKNEIALYAIHTNLDNVHNGVNRRICDKLGFKNLKILAPKSDLLKKLVVYVPVAHLDKVKKALFDVGAGNIGNYSECSFSVEGTGTFLGNENSNPFAGKKGKTSYEKEMRLETIFPSHLEEKLVMALIKSHPYEEPAYDIFALENVLNRVGAGLIGELDKELSKDKFLHHLKSKLNLKQIRFTETTKTTIRKVAVCGGSGSFLLKNALAQQADAFVTADFKYHDFFDAEKRLLVADVGHYESEIFTKELLRDLILEKFPTFAVLLSKINTNPVNYF